jgi:hypothetical protein
VFALVVLLGRKLAFCGDAACRKAILRSGRQAYCSPRCSQRVRTSRFKEMHPARVQQARRDHYVKAQQRKLGKKVKVGRRPVRRGAE